MKRVTTKDRDRTLRVVSGLTGGLTAVAVAATGLTTALAAETTQRKEALKLAAQEAADANLAVEPGATQTVTAHPEDDGSPSPKATSAKPKPKATTTAARRRTTSVRTTTAARRTTTTVRRTTSTAAPKPRTTTTTPAPAPRTTTKSSGS